MMFILFQGLDKFRRAVEFVKFTMKMFNW